MPQLLPIRGLRYTSAAGDLATLLAPPYDVINPRQQAELAARNPRNAVHLELAAGGEERYTHVARLLEAWQAEGYLARDPAPMLYVYEQEFQEEGRPYTRRAILAGVEAQPWDEGAVKPHEFTMSGPKEDRLKLLEATKTQLSPVFMIARDRAGQLRQFIDAVISARPADVSATTPEGDTHRVWTVQAGTFEMRHLAPLFPESFYIADGHHRYETAVTYRQRAAERERLGPFHPARYALSAIVAADDPGLVIRPIHRFVPRPAPTDWRQRLGEAFTIEPLAEPLAALPALEAGEPVIAAFGLEPGATHLLRLRDSAPLLARIPRGQSERWATIAPNRLRFGVLEPLWGIDDDALRAGAVSYSHDPEEVLGWAREQAGNSVAFLIGRVGIAEVMALADQGERMPQKSTFFYPKLGTGLVFHPLFE